MLIKTLQ